MRRIKNNPIDWSELPRLLEYIRNSGSFGNASLPVDLPTQTSGVLEVDRGGTGLDESDLTGNAGEVLVVNGTEDGYETLNLLPIDLESEVEGVLPADNGGTGLDEAALAGDAGKTVVVNGTEDGYILEEHYTASEVDTEISSAVAALQMLFAGGSTGEVLKKQSNTDYDFDWDTDDTGGGGSGYSEGTSFPGSPSSGDKFYRTDRNILYFYDGTRWLSVEQYFAVLGDTSGAGLSLTTSVTTNARCPNPWAGVYDLWVEHAAFSWNYSSTSGSPSWTLRLSKFTGTTATDIATHTPTASDTNWHSAVVTVDAVTASSVDMFTGGASELAGAVTFSYTIGFVYRLVG